MKNKVRKKTKLTFKQRLAILSCAIVALVCFCLAGMQLVYIMQRDNDFQENTGVNEEEEVIEYEEVKIQEVTNENNIRLLETKDAGQSYVDETLFLGDSNTARFLSYVDENGMPYTTIENTIGIAGMGVNAISYLACEQMSTGTYTMVQSVSILQPRRILMMFGTNNLTGLGIEADGFVGTYFSQIQLVQEAYPFADVIIAAIPPITPYTTYANLSMEQINIYNDAIYEMCKENNLYFLDTRELFVNLATGWGRIQYFDSDGLHLNQNGVAALLMYYRTHAVFSKDIRPKPLQDRPLIIGPLSNMLAIDPLTNKEFSSDVLAPSDQPQEETPVEEETPPTEEPVESTEPQDPIEPQDPPEDTGDDQEG